VKGHGAASGDRTFLQLASEISLADDELKALTEELAPRRQAWLFETCASGGWLDQFSPGPLGRLRRTGGVALTSSGNPEETSDWNESSYPAYYQEASCTAAAPSLEVLHGRFTYCVDSAFRREETIVAVTADPDGNGLVSLLEAYDAAAARIAVENQAYNSAQPTAHLGGVQHPGISTRGALAPCAFIGLADPNWYCRCFRHVPGP
jgi:hypothetical protein